MMKIDPIETQLISGKFPDDNPDLHRDYNKKMFLLANNKLIVDRDVWDRINWLTDQVLSLVGIEKVGGWEKLYRDPGDGRYWLLTYPFGELQGGGPPSLICKKLSDSEIKSGYLSPSEWDAHMKEFMRERNIRVISKDSSEETK